LQLDDDELVLKKPAGQLEQAADASADAYEPALHATHTSGCVAASAVDAVPTLQRLQAADPDREYEPALHDWHVNSVVLPCPVENVPDEHGRHSAAETA
jgi:hypothetical protein